MSRWGSLAVLLGLCAMLWWYEGVAARYALFGGDLALLLNVIASLMTAILCVVIVAEILLGVGIRALLDSTPTGFERASVYAVLGVVAVAFILSHFGVNIVAVLATSAVLTAIIGLALQPTLGGLIAGFTLHAERVLKIGDGILRDGEALTVTAIGWRSVIARKADGGRVVMSTSRILEGFIDILPLAVPIWSLAKFVAPISVEPRRISALVEALIADLAMVDTSQPISVSPATFVPERAQTQYIARYWVRNFEDRLAVEEQLLGRVWYAFQREDIAWPIPDFSWIAGHGLGWNSAATPAITLSHMVAKVIARLGDDSFGGLSQGAVEQTGILLLYADGERIHLPDRLEGCRCILLEGVVQEIGSELFNPAENLNVSLAAPGSSSRRMALRHLTERLADIIGPYAEFAVQLASVGEPDIRVIASTVALEIPDPKTRLAFASYLGPLKDQSHHPGYSFAARRGAAGLLRAEPLLRAETAVAIVAVPAEV